MRYIPLGLSIFAVCALSSLAQQKDAGGGWKSDFAIDRADLTSIGKNRYFILEPHYRLTLVAGNEKLVITVLDETRIVDGVEARVVEERETKDNQLVEVSKNYFAINRSSNDIYYFGEDVDIYKNGRVVSHEGAWLSGVEGARFGLMMPGEVHPQAMYYQELAPHKAMDRARIINTTETVTTPAGTFKQCLKIEETTPLEPGAREYKYYASGIGLIVDGSLRLLSYGKSR